MRILHTSDWHLGARLCDRDRSDEHRAFLNWLLEILKSEEVDLLLISGDIFDTSNPPNSAEALYYDFLCSLMESPCGSVIITGGNHDSVAKLNSPKALLKRLDIHIVGGAEKDPSDCIVDLFDSEGNREAIVCAVPFLRERDIRNPGAGESWDEREKGVAEGIRRYYSEIGRIADRKKGDENIPLIAMGHLFVTGSASGAGQRDLYVGNLGAVGIDVFPENISYTALGHIHRGQKVGGRENVRYSGAPIAMDFGENGRKEVVLVDFNGSELSALQTIDIPEFRKLIRFRGSLDEVCLQISEFEPPETPFWADAEIEGGLSRGDVSLVLNNMAGEKGFALLRIKLLKNLSGSALVAERASDIKDLSADEVFLERCRQADMVDEEIEELIPLYRELMVKIEEEDRAGEN